MQISSTEPLLASFLFVFISFYGESLGGRGYVMVLSTDTLQAPLNRARGELPSDIVSCPASLSHAEKESGETRIQFWFRAARLAASNQIAEQCHVIKKRLRCFSVYFALY